MQERAPYDLIADQWSQERHASGFREQPFVDRFLDLTAPGAHILDLGCGSGKPIGRYLLDRGFRLTGVDASLAMLDLARTNCPEAELIVGDMVSVALSDRYDGIIAWDSIFHIPKAEHPALFDNLYRWLRPGAPVLLSLGGSDGEFTDRMFNVEFIYSGHAPDVAAVLLREAGFDILLWEIDDPSSRGHLSVLCRKTARP